MKPWAMANALKSAGVGNELVGTWVDGFEEEVWAG